MSEYKLGEVCEHGRLARSCDDCWHIKEIARLTAERDELLQRANAERNRADRAEGELEAYRMRLAGALVAAEAARKEAQ